MDNFSGGTASRRKTSKSKMILLSLICNLSFGRVSVFNREDWRGVIDVVTNAKQVVASVQDVARKLAEYAKFRGETKYPGILHIFIGLGFSIMIIAKSSKLDSLPMTTF